MVLQVVASMRDDFEFHGQGAFEPDQVHFQQDAVFLTDHMTVEPSPKDSLERQAWQSTWQSAGWLQHNPLVSHNLRQIMSIIGKSPNCQTAMTIWASIVGTQRTNITIHMAIIKISVHTTNAKSSDAFWFMVSLSRCCVSSVLVPNVSKFLYEINS